MQEVNPNEQYKHTKRNHFRGLEKESDQIQLSIPDDSEPSFWKHSTVIPVKGYRFSL